MRLLSLLLAIATTLSAFGVNCADSVNVHFRVRHSNYDPSFDGNRRAMDDFISKVRQAAETGKLDSIIVYGYASPEGGDILNIQLARKRCSALAKYIAEKGGIKTNLIYKRPGGVAWRELRRLVAETPDVPSRSKILHIIDHTPVFVYDKTGKIIDGRKKQLMDLRGGRPWMWMHSHLFPKLRNAVGIALYSTPTDKEKTIDAIPDSVSFTGETEIVESPDSVNIIDIAEVIEAPDTITAVEEPDLSQSADLVKAFEGKLNDGYEPLYRFALKTNMLYYGILLPNLEFEWLINKHWSVAAEGNLAAWGSYKRERSYRITLLDAEGRYWIKPRKPWNGFYVGIMAGGGWYDLEKGTPGHYGWGVMSGITGGYMWPITSRLSLEAEIGAGYLFTRYKDYRPFEGHHVYMRTKELNYFGPLKLKFSLAWRFFEVKKPKTTIPAL